MKGLQESTSDGIFLVIKHGGIVQESKNPREGFEPIEVINPRSGDKAVKYIKRYKGVEALIKKITWYDREYQDTPFMGWKLLLDADGTACTLDLPFESRVGTRFMKLAENIDYSQPVEFSAWKGSDDKTAFSVKQGGENVPQKYTRDEPGNCPPPTQGFDKKWNFNAQKEFLHKRMIDVVVPKVQAANDNGHREPETPTTEGKLEETEAEKKATLLKTIQGQLAEIAEEHPEKTKTDLLTEWFDVQAWSKVELLPLDLLQIQSKKMEDELLPF